jgi:hypothetical protein
MIDREISNFVIWFLKSSAFTFLLLHHIRVPGYVGRATDIETKGQAGHAAS